MELKKQIYNEREEVDPDHQEKEEKSEYFDTFHASYIAGFPEKLAKDVKHRNVGITFSKGRSFFNSFSDFNLRVHKTWEKMLYTVGIENHVPKFTKVRLSNGSHLTGINMQSSTKTKPMELRSMWQKQNTK